jgi:cytochrome c oxidase subunit 1
MLRHLAYILIAGAIMTAIINTTLLSHEMFVTCLNAFQGTLFLILALLLAVPVIIWAMKKIRMAIWELFAAGMVCWLWVMITLGSLLKRSTFDFHYNDTLFVFDRLYLLRLLLVIMFLFSWTYYLLNKNGYRYYLFGRLHFWTTFLWLSFMIWPYHYEGLAGMPRRYLDLSSGASSDQFGGMNKAYFMFLLLFLIMQVLFIAVVVYSVIKNRNLINLKN